MTPTREGQETLEDLLQSLETIEAKIEERRSERCVMFIDLVGYTAYVDRHGDVAGRRRVQRAGDVALPIAERFGGRVVKGLGDGWMLLFTDANEAVQAAVEIERDNHQAQLLEQDPIELKIGLDFGRLLEESDDIYGDVVNVSSRLVSKCEGESILISHRVFEVLDPFYQQRCDPMEGMRIRGKTRSATAYQVRWRPVSDKKSVNRSRKLTVEVLWNHAESRIALTGGSESEDSLISYQTHPLALDDINRTSEQIMKAIASANVEGSAGRASTQLRESGERLFDLLLPPEVGRRVRESGAEFLVLKLDDACVHLPWELLHDGVDFLCCRFSVGRIVRTRQSTSVLKRSLPTESLSFLVLSNPTGDLPAASEEGKDLYDTYSATSRIQFEWLNDRVQTSEACDRLKDCDIVHYCGHAEFCSESPDESGWILSDGKFTAGGLEDFIRSRTPMPLLVFNNACHSGSTNSWEAGQAGWSFGLANAFLLAGSSHYVGAVSDLLDLSSRKFSNTFYRYVVAGHSVGDSLRLARTTQRSKSDEKDLTWAQYVLYGDPELGVFAMTEVPETSSARKAECRSDSETTSVVPLPSPDPGTNAALNEPVAAERLRTTPAAGVAPGAQLSQAGTPAGWTKYSVGASVMAAIALIALVAVFFFKPEGDSRVWTDKAVVLQQEGDLEGARAALEKAASVSPEDPFVVSLETALAKRIRREEDKEWLAEVREGIERIKDAIAAKKPSEVQIDPWTSRPVGIALLDVKHSGDPANRLGEDIVFAEELAKEFDQTGRWLLIERERLNAVLQELEIGSSDLADSQYATEVGRFLAVRGLLTGTVVRQGDQSRVSLRIIDTETRGVAAMATKSTTGDVTLTPGPLTEELVKRLERGFALQGRVVDSASDTVILNIGSLHGVQEGQKFDIYPEESNPRAAGSVVRFKPIAEIEVAKIDSTECACSIAASAIPLQPGMRARDASLDE